jgi:hypothetical protein
MAANLYGSKIVTCCLENGCVGGSWLGAGLDNIPNNSIGPPGILSKPMVVFMHGGTIIGSTLTCFETTC